MTTGRWQSTVRFGLPGVLAGLLLSWALGGNPPSTARAQATAPQAAPATGGEAGGTIAFTTAAGSGQLLYLIDTKAQALAVYRVGPDPQSPQGFIKLEAARQYRYDLKLEGYNNHGLEVSAIKSMVKAH